MEFKTLDYFFYQRDTVEVARQLLGKIIVRKLNGKLLKGIITETEAYSSENDPASHAFSGKTKRNEAMFGKSGFSYVYFIYGCHFCFNVVAHDEKTSSGAVLIRAVRPIEGVSAMKKLRNGQAMKNLTNGPGKFTQAFSITKKHNQIDITKNKELYILDQKPISNSKILKTPRIGIKDGLDLLWRFLYKSSF